VGAVELHGRLTLTLEDLEEDQVEETLIMAAAVNNQVNQETQELTDTETQEDQDNFHITVQAVVDLLAADNQDHQEIVHKVEMVVTEDQHQSRDHQLLWPVAVVVEVGVTQDLMVDQVEDLKEQDLLLKHQVVQHQA
jgi:hypothetical protein|tara:strand:- start:125 stop:535 length:411 start_codon:yes stop_codon:yes gene_type:complete